MKNIFCILALLAILVLPGQVFASSYYLTLEGTVGSISDNGGLASAAGVNVGDTVRYVVEIDTDRTGFATWHNGKDKEIKGTYYSSLYSGVLSGMSDNTYNYIDPYYSGFYSQTGNELSAIAWQNWSSDLQSLVVGSTINSLYEFAYSDTWGYTKIDLDGVTVTNISNTAPTPIPGAAFLMLGGLGVVGFVKRRFF
jgi:hypothetical protein